VVFVVYEDRGPELGGEVDHVASAHREASVDDRRVVRQQMPGKDAHLDE